MNTGLIELVRNAEREQADALAQLAADVRQAYEHHMQARKTRAKS